jgi:membrane protein implicated in regulation of membrane protease activity
MEPRFGVDFGDVRIHTDDEAAHISRQINAKAFTHGQDIYFGAGRYTPASDAGKRLLAHELTHVVQQGGVPALQREEEDEAALDLYGVSDIGRPVMTLYELGAYELLLVETDPSELHGEDWIDVVHLRQGGFYPHTVKRDEFNAFVEATGMRVQTVKTWAEGEGQTKSLEEEKDETETTEHPEEETTTSRTDEGPQLWSVEKFRAETAAGRLARRDKLLKQMDKKLALFYYQKEQSEKSRSDKQLYENLRILEVIYGELQTLALLWLEENGAKRGKQGRRVAGIRAFQTVLNHPRTLKSVEEGILTGVVQRHFPAEEIDTDLFETALGTYGSYADWLGGSGRDEWLAASAPENIAGGSYGLLANLLGLGVGSAKIHQARKDKKGAKRELELLDYKPQGQEELFGATATLQKQVAQVNKGLASDSATVGSSLNGITNAISTIIQGAASGATATAAALLANVTFAIGYGVGVILNLIQAGRDFFNVYKRRKGQKAVAKVIQAYDQRMAALRDEIGQVYDRITEMAGDTNLSLEDSMERTEREMKTVRAHQEEIAILEARRSAFAVSKRKQGAKGKGISGVLNLVGAAGGTALTIAGIAAAAGVGASLAAAGPVGWALLGTALLGILAFAIGKKIKQSLRKKNVKRMRQELRFVNEYIDKGSINGVSSPAYNRRGEQIATAAKNAEYRPSTRQYHAWHRFLVQPEGVKVEKKGWFNRLTSRRKSGTLSMGARREALQAYLGKYDKQRAGQDAIVGIIEALSPGAAGDVTVDVDDPQRPGTKKSLTMREVMLGLLQSYFPKDWQKMRSSLLSEDEKLREGAEQRLLSKLKLA